MYLIFFQNQRPYKPHHSDWLSANDTQQKSKEYKHGNDARTYKYTKPLCTTHTRLRQIKTVYSKWSKKDEKNTLWMINSNLVDLTNANYVEGEEETER